MTDTFNKKEKNEVIYGLNPVFEALKAGKRTFKELLVCKKEKTERLNDIFERADSLKIPFNNVTASKLTDLCGSDAHQGIGAVVSLFKTTSVEEIIIKIEKSGHVPLVLLLDSVVDPHNLGALIRTALCSGIDGIVIPKDRAASPSPAVSKASAGAMEHSDIAVVTNLVKTITELQKKGWWITGLDQNSEQTLYESDLSGPLGIVVGGEDKGIRPLVKKHCDFIVSIPQKGAFNSLNASVAGAVAMYEAFRQRSV